MTTQTEIAMKDIVFCCTNCDKQIIRNSEDHDYSKCDETEEYWYCVDCPIPDEEEEEEEEDFWVACGGDIEVITAKLSDMDKYDEWGSFYSFTDKRKK
jgi:hypothetical protein